VLTTFCAGGFKATDRARLNQKRAQAVQAVANVGQGTAQMDTIQFALRTHHWFKTIATFVQGLFAGVALWHIVGAYMLLLFGFTVFLEHYFILALPVQCLFYFLFAICTVYALDRCVFTSNSLHNQFILSFLR